MDARGSVGAAGVLGYFDDLLRRLGIADHPRTGPVAAAGVEGGSVRVLPLPNSFVRFAVHRAHDMIGVRAAVAATAPVARTTSEGAPIGRGLSATWTEEA